MRSLLLGLDVSPRRMGWGLVDLVSGEPVACGCEAIELPKNGWDRGRVTKALRQIPTDSNPAGRNIATFPEDYEVQAIYLEMPALPPKSGTKGAFNAGRAYQVVWDECRSRWPWAPREALMPSEWRKLAGLPGNADKQDVMEEARAYSRYCIPVHEQDAADALLIAVAGQRRNGENWSRAVERGEAA